MQQSHVIGKNIVGKIEGNNIQVGDRIYQYQQYDEGTKNAIFEAIVKAIKQLDISRKEGTLNT